MEKKQQSQEKEMGKDMEKPLKTEEAMALLRSMLKEAGFNPKEPDLNLAWTVFKDFGTRLFDCADDSQLFEAVIYEIGGEEKFCLSMVRQFTVEVEEEYDYIEQIHLDLIYQLDDRLAELEETIWTYDFDDDAAAFYRAVEECAAFTLAGSSYTAAGCEIFQDEV